VGISKKALAKVSADLDTECTKAKATQKEFLDKMAAHTDRTKHSLDLDKMQREKKVKLGGREWDLEVRKAALAEAQTWGLNPRVNHDDLIEFIELQRLLQDAEADRIVEVG
jgi:hypothetical protein